MKIKETQFFKLLEFYQKCDHFIQSCMTSSSLKSPIFKTVCCQALYILFCIYLIINPIRHIVTLILYGKIEIHLILMYGFTVYFRGYLSVFALLKLFRKSQTKRLAEAVAEIKIEEDDEKYSIMNIMYSFKAFYSIICFTVLSNIFVDFNVPYLNSDLMRFLTFPISTNDISKISVLGIQTALNSISLILLVTDLHLCLIIGFTLSYEFNKLANEAKRFVTEKQSDHSNFITKQKDITEICSAHNILSRTLKFVNESLQLTPGFIVVASIFSCCIATYGIINDLLTNNIYTYLYILMLASGCFFYLILLILCGIYLNKSVHSITQSVHFMQFQDVKQEVIAKILVFLNRLTTESHGIDVGGCFVITPSSVLTMMGSFITYILVVIQTKPS